MKGVLSSPSPAATLARVSVLAVLVILLHAAVAFALIEAWESPARLLFVGIAAAVSGVIAVAMFADVVRRSAVLIRTRERFERERIPPSPSALRDAARAPARVAGAVILGGLLVSAFELVSGGAVSGQTGAELWSAAYAWVGMSLLLWTPLTFLVRGAMARWLRPYDPRELTKVSLDGLTSRLAADLLFTLLGALAAGGAVYLAFARGDQAVPPWLGFALVAAGLVFLVVFPFVVWQTRRLESSVKTIAHHVRGHRPGMLLAVSDAEIPLLALSLRRLEARFADTLRRETGALRSGDAADEAQALLMARVTHDLKSPLNAVLGFSDLLLSESEGALAPAQKGHVGDIVRAAGTLLELLSDLWDAALLERGRLTLERHWTPPVEVLTNALAVGQTLAEGKPGVTFSLEVEPGLPAMFVDPKRITQAIVRILRLAVPSLPENSPAPAGQVSAVEVRLRARSEKGSDGEPRVVVTVSSPAISARAEDYALARDLVRAHGGDVRVETAKGDGGNTRYSTFTVTVPLNEPAEK